MPREVHGFPGDAFFASFFTLSAIVSLLVSLKCRPIRKVVPPLFATKPPVSGLPLDASFLLFVFNSPIASILSLSNQLLETVHVLLCPFFAHAVPMDLYWHTYFAYTVIDSLVWQIGRIL